MVNESYSSSYVVYAIKMWCENWIDDQIPGLSEASNSTELVEKVREIIDIDANFTRRMLAVGLNTSKNTIWRILSEDLGKVNNLCAFY